MKKLILICGFGMVPMMAQAAFMDAEWAKKACDGWNASETLTTELAGEAWMDNDGGRGYKIIQIYRTDCGEDTKIQLNIEPKDGKAICTYGGPPDGKTLNKKMDYIMHATDEDWTCIGEAKWGCGAMGAMMSGKLKFTGPKMEAMGVMGPFGAFLKLTGQIGGEKTACK